MAKGTSEAPSNQDILYGIKYLVFVIEIFYPYKNDYSRPSPSAPKRGAARRCARERVSERA